MAMLVFRKSGNVIYILLLLTSPIWRKMLVRVSPIGQRENLNPLQRIIIIIITIIIIIIIIIT